MFVKWIDKIWMIMGSDSTNHTQIQRGLMKVFQWFVYVVLVVKRTISSISFISSHNVSYTSEVWTTHHWVSSFTSNWSINYGHIIHSLHSLSCFHSSQYHPSERVQAVECVGWIGDVDRVYRWSRGLNDEENKIYWWEIITDDTQFIFKS